MAHKLIAKASVLVSIPDMYTTLPFDIAFHVVGILIVWDLLVTWFDSGLPSILTRLLWKTGWKRNDPYFWPDDITDPMTWGKIQWVVWINLTFPTLGELLTCPVCLSRHLSYIVCILMWVFMPVSPINLLGALFWPVLATRLHKLL